MFSGVAAVFASLANPNFRLYFFAQTVSVAGTWMQRVGQSWLVLELTGSGAMLGAVVAVQHGPSLLLGPWGGLLADRRPKRLTIIWAQVALAALAGIFGYLTLLGAMQIWIVFVLAGLVGVVESLERPARHSFVHEMVGKGHLTNAIALHSIVVNLGRSIGPAIAGILISTAGIGVAFLVNAASYFPVLAALMAMDRSRLTTPLPVSKEPGQIRDGVRYVRANPVLLGTIVLMAVAGMLTFEWSVTLPLYARDSFGGDARVFGWMLSALGAGAVVGGVAVARYASATSSSLMLLSLTYGVLLLIAGLVPSLLVVLGMLFVIGAAHLAVKSVALSLIQIEAETSMRGRTVALFSVATVGARPIGAPILGWTGDVFGGRSTLVLGGLATAAAAAVYYTRLRSQSGSSSKKLG